MTDHAIIRGEGVSFRYAQEAKNAVDDVSFQIEKDEFFTILGRNGSGKSTLAKLLNALYVPTAGKIEIDGLNTSDEKNVWEIRSRCGMLFQNPDNQIVATSVEEDVAFGLENLGVESKEIRRRVDEALDMVGMRSFAQFAPHMLSGGQKQRVAIAGVLAMRPRVIVFDEATAMLDPSGRTEVFEIVRRLNREEGITVVWITHFMEEAALSKRLAVMDEGRIVMEGAPGEVFDEIDRVRGYGLDVPEMTALSRLLREAGVEVRNGILSVGEMVVELCRLKS